MGNYKTCMDHECGVDYGLNSKLYYDSTSYSIHRLHTMLRGQLLYNVLRDVQCAWLTEQTAAQ